MSPVAAARAWLAQNRPVPMEEQCDCCGHDKRHTSEIIEALLTSDWEDRLRLQIGGGQYEAGWNAALRKVDERIREEK